MIDFSSADFGDPWEEFNRIVWSAQASPAFARGQLHGYFPDGAPETFWKLLQLYLATNALGALPWAISDSSRLNSLRFSRSFHRRLALLRATRNR